MPDSSPECANKHWAIAIVHGLGTPGINATSRDVCCVIKKVKRDFVLAGELRTDPKTHATVGEWAFTQGRARVMDVHWGDLSFVRGSPWSMVTAVCTNLYGAVYVNSRILQKSNVIIRFLPIIPFYLIRRVVLPLHLVALCLIVADGLVYFDRAATSRPLSREAFFGLTAILLAAIACFVAVYLARRQSVRTPPWDVAASFAIFSALSVWFATPAAPAWLNQCLDEGTKTPILTIIYRMMFRRDIGFGDGLCGLIQRGIDQDRAPSGVDHYLSINEFVGDSVLFLCAGIVILYIALALAHWAWHSTETWHAMRLVPSQRW